MSSNQASAPNSLLVRFLDNFLQERNIKWVLILGMMILLGSSLLLVSSHWDTYTPAWKYFIFLAYTTLVFGSGEWARQRLGLPRTATVLQSLTVLLVPITFLVLHWVMKEEGAGLLARGLHLALFGANVGLAVAAARRIFHHFLRGHQVTFLASYLILSVAGAIVPGLPEAWAPVIALALWAVFAAGSVKVNRHVFWMTEERRLPRIFGFFPILLLGLQFLLLLALHAPWQIGLDWLGLGGVLVAIPIMLTADAVARVFQQRTGNIVRPLPLAIIGPLTLGLVLCAAGVCLSGISLVPPSRPHALVLTAALAACMMGVTARRTGHATFVWAMLAGVVLAYNFSPAFFTDLARTVLDQGAQIVHEERLPYAFYGLTYLPLLLAVTVAARALTRIRDKRVPDDLFAPPLRLFAVALGCLMLAVSLGHPKATFPVGLCMTAAFAFQAIVLRDGRLALPAIGSWLVAAWGFTPFAASCAGWPVPAFAEIYAFAVAAAVLLGAGRFLDGPIARLVPEAWKERDPLAGQLWQSLCRSCSLLVALLLAAYWLAHGVRAPLGIATWPVSLSVAVLVATHALHFCQPILGGSAIVCVQALLVLHALGLPLPVSTVLSFTTLLLVAQWLLRPLWNHAPSSRLSRTFGQASDVLSSWGLCLGLVFVYLPIFLVEMVLPLLNGSLAPTHSTGLIAWPYQLLIALWALAAAWRWANPILTALGCVGLLAVGGTLFLEVAGPLAALWLPTVWVTMALVALPATEWLQRRARALTSDANAITNERYQSLVAPIEGVMLSVFALAAVASLLAFPVEMRVAGTAGLAGLAAFSVLRRQPAIRVPALIVLNWHVISLTVLGSIPGMRSLLDLAYANLLPLFLPMSAMAAASLFVWHWRGEAHAAPWREAIWTHLWALRGLGLVCLLGSLRHAELGKLEIVLAASTFALAVATELWAACRQALEERVWSAEALALAAVGYFAFFRVVTFGRGITMFVVLAVGIVLWLVSAWARGRGRWHVLQRPLSLTALALPLATVAIGVGRHLYLKPVWLGGNSLALLLAAGFYFWRGLERRSKPFVILAGAIVNIALVLLWRELTWDDPQFFMIPIGISILALVQLLKQEIPEKLHDPLRYLGALVILVSPTFHIVGGSWIHLFSLMVVSVGIVLVAIGLRVRALMYTGTAFLAADLVAMVVRGSVDNPNVLWIAGLALGAAVIALGAYCERNREAIVDRIRLLSEALKQWE